MTISTRQVAFLLPRRGAMIRGGVLFSITLLHGQLLDPPVVRPLVAGPAWPVDVDAASSTDASVGITDALGFEPLATRLLLPLLLAGISGCSVALRLLRRVSTVD